MANKSMVYLAKKGKVFGPYTEQEYEQMHRNGGVDQFSWIWDMGTSQWKAMDPAPQPLKIDDFVAHKPAIIGQPAGASFGYGQEQQLPRSNVDKFVEARNIAAICHDYHHAVAGKIGDVTATGCELLSDEPYAAPPLCARSLVHLNLLDETSGKSVNVEARIFDIQKTHRGWMYRIRWDQMPALL